MGGTCVVGDKGPGGGIVFYDAGSPQSWGRYLEATPYAWNGGSRDPRAEWGCMETSISGALGTAIGTGATNTAAIVAGCPESGIAAKLADLSTFGGKSDWFLPSKDELNLMYRNLARPGAPGFETDPYWSSSEYGVRLAWSQDIRDGGQYFYDGEQHIDFRNLFFYVRPVRAFGQSQPGTITTTTVVLVKQSCASGGVCVIGDNGPGGGIVFYDAGSPQSWGRYLEAAPRTWSGGTIDPEAKWGCESIWTSIWDASREDEDIGTGAANTAAIVAGCPESGIAAKLANALIFGGKADWFLPSKDELNLMYRNLGRWDVGGFETGAYWSSSENGTTVAQIQNLETGRGSGDYRKSVSFNVRPVRAFG